MIHKTTFITILTAIMFTGTAKAASGSQLFTTHCATCHGLDGAGFKAKRMGARPLGSPAVQAMSDAELAETISQGRGEGTLVRKHKMSSWKGVLAKQEITDLVKHIRTLKK